MINKKYKEIEIKITKLGIAVIVTDLHTNESVKYESINQAARNLAAHPKTIWRRVQDKKPYLERFIIRRHYPKRNLIHFFMELYLILYTNYTILFYVLLDFILLGYILYKFIPCAMVLYTEIYNNYFYTINKMNVNELKFELVDYKLNNIFGCLKIPITDKVKGLVEFNKEWRSVCLLKNKTSFINGFSSKAEYSIYQSIINSINLDFHTNSNNFATLNSSHSSPLIERVNINNIFSNAIASTRPTISIVDTVTSHNSLVIQTQSIHNYRNFSIIDSALIGPRSPGRELLNYNSNVLYCIINGISPSTY